jgi:superfamily II DNA or RNA helicase
MASIALKAIERAKPKIILIITESIKIYEQLAKELPVIDINAGVKDIHIEPGKVYLAMSQTLARRQYIIDAFIAFGFDVIVMNDEAHIGTATKILRQFKDKCYILGFTATPDFRAAKHLPDIYKACVQACQVDELIQDGFLCTYRHIARDKFADLDILEIRGADFSEESQEKAFGTSEVYDGLIEDLGKHKFKKAMVFCASIEHCEETYQQLIENGFRACRYHSGNKKHPLKNPEFELAKFKELDLCNICVSVSSLTKGFDYPPIDLVCILRKTKSLPLYLQMIGRGSRPIYVFDNNGKIVEIIKNSFIVLDYGSHWKTLGLYWDDRDWTSLWLPPPSKKKKDGGGGIATVKACENCDELIPVQARVCPACGYEYPEVKKELEIGESVEVTKSYTDLIGKKTGELSAYELAIYAKIKNKTKYAVLMAKFQEKERPGFIADFAGYMGFQKDWVSMIRKEAKTRPVQGLYNVTLK